MYKEVFLQIDKLNNFKVDVKDFETKVEDIPKVIETKVIDEVKLEETKISNDIKVEEIKVETFWSKIKNFFIKLINIFK